MKRSPLLSEIGAWVGPPVLVLVIRGTRTVLDGRERLAEHKARGFRTHVPELVVTSYLDAMRALIHHGHSDRAARLAEVHLPHALRMTQGALARLLDVSHQRLTAFKRAAAHPSERHKLPRRALSVVRKVQRIRSRMLEGERIEINDIEEALGAFLEE